MPLKSVDNVAYLALGCNLGEREASLNRAIELLDAHGGIRVTARSTFHETPALMPADAPAEWNKPYLNAAIEINTSLSPETLLEEVKSVEILLGRTPQKRWAPREMDIDILCYGEQIITSPHLTIPHPQMHLRSFVLQPLCEIAPELLHPSLGISMAQILRQAA